LCISTVCNFPDDHQSLPFVGIKASNFYCRKYSFIVFITVAVCFESFDITVKGVFFSNVRRNFNKLKKIVSQKMTSMLLLSLQFAPRIAYIDSFGFEKCLPCSVCGKMYRTTAHLQRHMRSHTDERPFLCTICGMAFRLKHHLKEHLFIHSGEKPHKCDICGRGFAFTRDLRTHKIRHMKKAK
jgi:hypothetical protein